LMSVAGCSDRERPLTGRCRRCTSWGYWFAGRRKSNGTTGLVTFDITPSLPQPNSAASRGKGTHLLTFPAQAWLKLSPPCLTSRTQQKLNAALPAERTLPSPRLFFVAFSGRNSSVGSPLPPPTLRGDRQPHDRHRTRTLPTRRDAQQQNRQFARAR